MGGSAQDDTKERALSRDSTTTTTARTLWAGQMFNNNEEKAGTTTKLQITIKPQTSMDKDLVCMDKDPVLCTMLNNIRNIISRS